MGTFATRCSLRRRRCIFCSAKTPCPASSSQVRVDEGTSWLARPSRRSIVENQESGQRAQLVGDKVKEMGSNSGYAESMRWQSTCPRTSPSGAR
eukprot:2906867-Pleurochrysis_carterae.AAC.4